MGFGLSARRRGSTSGLSLSLDFLSGVLDNRITFTRGSTGTYFNSSGVLSSAAINTPRFDYDPVTLAPKGLLIEEARTNLLTYSEQFDNAAWVKSSATITANATTAPDGTNTADRVQATAPAVVTQDAVVNATSATYTIYAKQGSGATEGSRFLLRNVTTATNLIGILLDYSTGGITYTVGSSGASATNVGNGWWRISLSAATGITSGNQLSCYVGFTGGGSAGQFMFAWGAQLEAGAFATSYIPTVASTATRSADVATMTGTNFSGWYNQSEGTLVVSASQPTIFAASRTASALSYSGTGSRVGIYRQSAGPINGFVTPGAGGITSGVSATANTVWKGVIAYDTATGYVAANGSAVATGAHTATLSLFDNFGIGGYASGVENFSGHIRSIAYFNTRLPDAQLQALTA